MRSLGAADYEAAGLYDPSVPNAAARMELLEWLTSHGFTIAEMTAAQADGQLTSLPADRALLDGSPIDLAEAAKAADLAPRTLVKLLRASGFAPDRARITTGSIELFRLFGAARSLFSEAEALHFVRVMGSSLARIADAANSLFLLDVEAPLRHDATTSELHMAETQLFATEMLDGVCDAIGTLFRLHVDDSIRHSRDMRRGTGELEVVSMAVGFVDLVGYTTLTEAASMRELLALLIEFESHAYDIVTERGGRVIKMMGDEVMFIAFDPAAAATIALEMVEQLRARGNVAPRGGLAFGEILSHGGDCYGPVVNLASRVADIAVPWEILVTDELATRVEGRFGLEPAGRRMLKGFTEPVALRALQSLA
jgi:adenylate cyclase